MDDKTTPDAKDDELKLPEDLEPSDKDAEDVSGGIGLLVPAVQKVREAAARNTP